MLDYTFAAATASNVMPVRYTMLIVSALFFLAACGINPLAATPTAPPPPLPTGAPAQPSLSASVRPAALPGLNRVVQVAFGPDGALWAVANNALVRWDLLTATPQVIWQRSRQDQWITDLMLTPEGVIWVATNRALLRYEGTAWRAYTVADGLPSLIINGMAADDEGTIWAATAAGLSWWDGDQWQRDDVTAGRTLQQLAVHGETLWLESDEAIRRYDRRSGALVPLPNPPSEGPNPPLTLLGVDKTGSPWAYQIYGPLYRFADGAWWQLDPLDPGAPVCDLVFDPANNPWLATCGSDGRGLLTLVDGGWQRVTMNDGLFSNSIRTVAVRYDGLIAVGGDLGLQTGRPGAWQPLRSGPHLPITALAVTADGSVWTASNLAHQLGLPAGVVQYDGDGWRYWDHADLPAGLGESVSTLQVAPDGVLWAASGCTVGTYKRDREPAWQLVATCDQLNGNVFAIDFAPDGVAWLTTGFGLYRLENGQFEQLSDRLASALAVADDGSVWISGWHGTTNSAYLAQFGAGGWQEYPIQGRLLGITADQRVWAVDGDRVVYFDGDVWQPQALPVDWTVAQLCASAVDHEGTLWLGTARGALRFAAGRWQNSIPADEAVCPIAFGADGRLWYATAMGLNSLVRK